ncbi:BlaI/MecI/CopY family transcriptional regulator [Streptomyces sp. NPDC051104]|uniref:BlaI/MecI/CopY family transcriptional regulator n=1 Tax=Streptomyces sp. NPDC051104 TaxID=3155044 RepID=UPI0034204CA0
MPARLHAKALLEREQAGRAHTYRPCQAPPETAAHQMNATLARGSDRAAVLQRFVEALAPPTRRPCAPCSTPGTETADRSWLPCASPSTSSCWPRPCWLSSARTWHAIWPPPPWCAHSPG